MKCKHCDNETGTRSKRFCSIECMRRVNRPENYYHCKMCGIEFYSSKAQGSRDYCSRKCLGKANHLRIYEVKKPQILEGIALGMSMKDIVHDYGTTLSTIRLACQQEGIDYDGIKRGGHARISEAKLNPTDKQIRKWVACALLHARRGGVLSKCYKDITGGVYTNRAIHGHVAKYCNVYNRISKERRERSKWKKNEAKTKRMSMLFKTESAYRDYIARLYDGAIEVPISQRSEGRGRRCDVVAKVCGVSYAIEVKHVSRTSDLDKALGQALMSAYFLKIKAAVAIPQDCFIDDDFIKCCKSFDVLIIR
jgi:hypothetical protein